MSQSRFLQEGYLKKYRKAANNAAINSAITDLVAARNVRHADGGKRLIKSSNSYKNVIASLQSAGVIITYDAMMKRVSRASVEDIITEIRSTNTSTESVVSSLSSPREQADDDSLTSEKTAETTSHNDQSLGTPELKSGVGGRLKGSSRTIKNCIQRGSLTTHHGAKSPLEEVELALVEICIQMGKIRQPLSCTEAIALMNDMIENTNTKQNVIKFQQSRRLGIIFSTKNSQRIRQCQRT
jgi:hypothetical protein